MRALTLCLAYYENPRMLARQYRHLAALPDDVKACLSLIVVDDGSPEHPAPPPPEPLGFGFSLYRMLVDVPWNQDACRNLAVAQAETDWVLLTDMDHIVPGKVLGRLIGRRFSPDIAYTFRRVSEPDLNPYKPHPNSWLLTRALYDKAGGYDERFAGVYGTDGMFRRRVREAGAGICELKEAIIRVPREVVPDASTTRYERRSPENAAARARVKAEIAASGNRWPMRGRFPWERVG